MRAPLSAHTLAAMSNPTKHQGRCHCGKVRYEVALDLAEPVIACNCSMCGRAGTLLAFASEQDFQLLSGEEALTDYRFNKHVIEHLFCSTCGIKSFGRGTSPAGTPMVAVNVRCLDDVEVGKLNVRQYDGRSA